MAGLARTPPRLAEVRTARQAPQTSFSYCCRSPPSTPSPPPPPPLGGGNGDRGRGPAGRGLSVYCPDPPSPSDTARDCRSPPRGWRSAVRGAGHGRGLLSSRPAPRRVTELPSPAQPAPPRTRPLGSSVFVLKGRTEPPSSFSRDGAARHGSEGAADAKAHCFSGCKCLAEEGGGEGRRRGWGHGYLSFSRARGESQLLRCAPQPALQPLVQPDTTGPTGNRPPLEWREMPPLLQKRPCGMSLTPLGSFLPALQGTSLSQRVG